MYAGQEVSLHDALAVTLLTSANNYAESVAAWAFGSREAYLEAARAWLAANGLSGTTLADASGLDPGSASTTADLLKVAALAHANPALAAIAGLATYDQPDLGTIANQNILLGENGVDGLKTGSTSYAGFTLLTSAVVTVGATPVTLVSVVLGTESLDARFDTTRALLASAQAGLREVTLATAGTPFGTYTLPASGTAEAPSDPGAATDSDATTDPGAATADAVATRDLTTVVFGDTPITTEVTLEERAAGAAGDLVGTAVFTVGTTRLDLPLALATPLA
ncbi:D-alanyl-D-alanine carboxypeptidase family protein [Herbiconiux sp. P15]|uniref:D-alanyl-D-alanine carboxypeptidase family protein n=1 Tax=Herbiconiux liukaitaii TaxID=3342799 RepID=UPI0035B89D00